MINADSINFSYKDSVLNVKPFEFHINDGVLEGVIVTLVVMRKIQPSNFDANIITQIFKDERLKFFLIFGEPWIGYENNDFNIDADISLKKGTYMNEKFDEMTLSGFIKMESRVLMIFHGKKRNHGSTSPVELFRY